MKIVKIIAMKRSLFFVFCFLFFAFFLSGCIKKKVETPAPRPKIQEVVNTVPLSERVYATLSFASSSNFPLGRELTLTVADSKSASLIEYELEYQAGTLVQAGLGSISTKDNKPPYSKDILLGSCSAGGACSYHEDVKGGTLLLRFKGSPVGNLKGEWNYYAPGNDGKLSSRDAKFQLDAPKLKKAFVVVSQTLGLPKIVEGDVLAGPYHLASTAGVAGEMELTMRLVEETPTAKLLFWNGSSYQPVKHNLEGKTATATISSAGTYLVVK